MASTSLHQFKLFFVNDLVKTISRSKDMQHLLGIYKIHSVSNHASPALRVTGCSVPSQLPFGVKVRSTPWTSRQFITGPAQQTNTHMLARSLMLDGWKLKYPVQGRANCMQKQLMVTELSQPPSTIKEILHLVIRLTGLFPESICHFGQNKQRRQMNEICRFKRFYLSHY